MGRTVGFRGGVPHLIMNLNTAMGGGAAVFAAMAAGLLSAVFWMVVGWRAMRAHERLADASEIVARKVRESERL